MNLKGLRVTKNSQFSLLTHTKQLWSVTFFDTAAGIGNSEMGSDANTNAIWTDRREGWNSYVDGNIAMEIESPLISQKSKKVSVDDFAFHINYLYHSKLMNPCLVVNKLYALIFYIKNNNAIYLKCLSLRVIQQALDPA